MSKFRVAKNSTIVTVVHAAQATFSTANVALNGVLWTHKTKIASNSDAGATYTLNIVDDDSVVVYQKAGISGSSGSVITNLTGDTRIPLAGIYTVQIVFSANQTVTDNVVTVSLMIDKG